MEYTNGEDRIIYIKINGIYTPIGCLTGSNFQESTEMLSTTTRDNKGWATSRPMLQSYNLSFDGIQINTTMAGGNFNIASYDRLKIIKRDKLLVEWKLQGTKYPVVDLGKGYITDISSAENVGELMTFNGTITGFGKPIVQDLGGLVLNSGDPNELIISENNLIKVQ